MLADTKTILICQIFLVINIFDSRTSTGDTERYTTDPVLLLYPLCELNLKTRQPAINTGTLCVALLLVARLPIVTECCGCVNDLKSAAAIIAVLGIVTSPAVSWAIVRHSYVVRVSCVITTNAARPDVVDINLRNSLSFGFGANAGLGPSCLTLNTTDSQSDSREALNFVQFVRYTSWIVLLADICFLICSVNLLITIYKGSIKKSSKLFLCSGAISIVLSFIHGILYISACISVGGAFPIFELIFAVVDLIMWTYFLIVVFSYRRGSPS